MEHRLKPKAEQILKTRAEELDLLVPIREEHPFHVRGVETRRKRGTRTGNFAEPARGYAYNGEPGAQRMAAH